MAVSVIGAGVSGLSIAFQLLDRGLGPVTIHDRTGVSAGASSVQPGGVRRQWSTRATCLMAQESRAFYDELPERLGVEVDARLDLCGYLFAADTAETLAQLRANIEVQNSVGVPSRLVAPDEAATLVPGVLPDGFVGAAFCPDDGYFDRPQAVVAAFAEAACARGAELSLGHEVLEVAADGAGWRIRTAAGATTADQVVVAAAAGSTGLLAPLGFDLPIRPEARHLFFGEMVAERVLDPLVIAIDRGIAVKQLADGRLLASDLRAEGDPVAGRPRWETRLREQLATTFSDVELLRPTMVSGVYDMTPDAQPIVDELADGLWVAAGFSGHGFMIAPSTGALVAGAIAGDEDPEWRDAVSWGRFAGHGRSLESQVI